MKKDLMNSKPIDQLKAETVNSMGISPDTPLYRYDGTKCLAKELKVGDVLMGDNNNPVTIQSIQQGNGTMYTIDQNLGYSYTVTEDTVLCLKFSNVEYLYWDNSKNGYKVHWFEKTDTIKLKCKSFVYRRTKTHKGNGKIDSYWTRPSAKKAAEIFLQNLPDTNPNHLPYGTIVEISVKDYIQLTSTVRKESKGYKVPFQFPKRKVQLDPWVLGHWLGDGHSAGAMITTADQEILDVYTQFAADNGLVVKEYDKYKYGISTGQITGISGTNPLLNQLKHYDLIDNKHMPSEYMTNSRDIQLKVLAGFIDSDGSYDANRNVFTINQAREHLIDELEFISRSLGIGTSVRKNVKSKWTDKYGNTKSGIYHFITMTGPILADIPTVVERKQSQYDSETGYHSLNTGFTVKKVKTGKFISFQLDGNHRYLLYDFTVAHD